MYIYAALATVFLFIVYLVLLANRPNWNQHSWSAGQRRKFARNMRENLSARIMGVSLAKLYPVAAVAAFIVTTIALNHIMAVAGVMVAMAGVQVARPAVVTFGADEWIADIPLAALPLPAAQLPTQGGQIPNMRFMKSITLWWEGRITNAGSNNPSGVTADGLFALIDTIQVKGTHKVRGKQELFINVRGADMREWCAIYEGRWPACYINKNGALKNASALGLNGLSNAYANAQLSTAASEYNDIRFAVEIPFVPLGVNAGQQIDFLLDAPNYDNLQLTVSCGDDLSVFTYGSHGAPSFTAYGASSGSPQIRVYGTFAKQGPSAFAGFVPARVFRWFNEITGSTMTTTAPGVRLNNINRGNKIRALLVKTGTRSTAVSGGFSSYATLLDTVMSGNIQFMQGTNKQIRFWQNYIHLAEFSKRAYQMEYDTGYALIDFARHGSVREALNLRGAVVGATGDVDTYLQSDIVGASNQAELLMYEELYYDPSINGIPYQSY